jgi:hypothetical protein
MPGVFRSHAVRTRLCKRCNQPAQDCGMTQAKSDSSQVHCDPGAARIPAPFASFRQT